MRGRCSPKPQLSGRGGRHEAVALLGPRPLRPLAGGDRSRALPERRARRLAAPVASADRAVVPRAGWDADRREAVPAPASPRPALALGTRPAVVGLAMRGARLAAGSDPDGGPVRAGPGPRMLSGPGRA